MLQEYDTGEGKFQPAIEDLERTNQDLRDEIASRRAAALRLKETILEVHCTMTLTLSPDAL